MTGDVSFVDRFSKVNWDQRYIPKPLSCWTGDNLPKITNENSRTIKGISLSLREKGRDPLANEGLIWQSQRQFALHHIYLTFQNGVLTFQVFLNSDFLFTNMANSRLKILSFLCFLSAKNE